MKAPANLIEIADGTVALSMLELATLRRIAIEPTEIKSIEKPFASLVAKGLVKHRFVTDKSDWPVAVAVLTPKGEKVIDKVVAA